MSIRLYECQCLFEETKNTVEDSEVKSYVLITECDDCRIKREADAEVQARKNKIQEIINELDELDRKAMRPLLDNETERLEEIKTRKLELREELHLLG